ncbi:MAG: alpha/beta hydrolase [Pseudomonadota bacterium]
MAAPAALAESCAREKVDKVEVPNTVWVPDADGDQVPLWPEGATIASPDLDGHQEMIGSGSPLIAGRPWHWATYVSRPTMTIYRPKGEPTGAATLVLPGGGYAAVAMDLEGTEVCDWITAHGVTCVLLKYRVPQTWRAGRNGVRVPPEHLLPLEDAQRAMSLLRRDATAYGIDPQKIGVIGFSAGAHLAAALSNARERAYAPIDDADEERSTPDFAVVLYPGRFLPEERDAKALTLAPWMTISSEAPPTLLIHAMNDRVNDVRQSIAYGMALHEAGVAVDMRFYADGCHAFGLRPTSAAITTEWPDQAVAWLTDLGMLRGQSNRATARSCDLECA